MAGRLTMGFGHPSKERFQGVQVSRDPFGVSPERLVGHVGETEQGEHHLATGAVGDDAHRDVDLAAAGDGDVVVKDAEVVSRCEPDLDWSRGGVRDPFAVRLLQRPGEP
jgi:hypothetical protein